MNANWAQAGSGSVGSPEVVTLASWQAQFGSASKPGAGSGSDKMTDISRDEVDAKIALSNAQTDTKFARLEGKLDLVLSKMAEVQESTRATRANQWVIGTALAVLIVALAFGVPTVFGFGLQLRDVVHSEVLNSHSQNP